MLKVQATAAMNGESLILLKTISWIYRSQPKVRYLSQLSHGLTGRDRTIASIPDTRQGTDLQIRIEAHWPDARLIYGSEGLRMPGQRPEHATLS
jgi:hypothetical protein